MNKWKINIADCGLTTATGTHVVSDPRTYIVITAQLDATSTGKCKNTFQFAMQQFLALQVERKCCTYTINRLLTYAWF